jgi:hypothetical protein
MEVDTYFRHQLIQAMYMIHGAMEGGMGTGIFS